MSKKWLLKYKGLNTFGVSDMPIGILSCFDGGIIVGYFPQTISDILIAKIPNNSGWSDFCREDLEFFNSEEKKNYELCTENSNYSYLACTLDNVKIGETMTVGSTKIPILFLLQETKERFLDPETTSYSICITICKILSEITGKSVNDLYNSDCLKQITKFNYQTAVDRFDATGDEEWFWWSEYKKENRFKYLDWLIEEYSL